MWIFQHVDGKMVAGKIGGRENWSRGKMVSGKMVIEHLVEITTTTRL